MCLSSRDRDHLAGALRTLMEEWSERNWCAGWMDGLEYMLWKEVMDGNEPVIGTLARLSETWWTFEEAVPLHDWIAIFLKNSPEEVP